MPTSLAIGSYRTSTLHTVKRLISNQYWIDQNIEIVDSVPQWPCGNMADGTTKHLRININLEVEEQPEHTHRRDRADAGNTNNPPWCIENTQAPEQQNAGALRTDSGGTLDDVNEIEFQKMLMEDIRAQQPRPRRQQRARARRPNNREGFRVFGLMVFVAGWRK
jgi:hypothetical protein